MDSRRNKNNKYDKAVEDNNSLLEELSEDDDVQFTLSRLQVVLANG